MLRCAVLCCECVWMSVWLCCAVLWVCVSESVCVVVEGEGGRREEVRLVASKNYSAGEPHMIFFYTFGQCCWVLPSLSWEWCGVVCCGVIPETWTCKTILYHTLLYCNILYYALLYYSISCCTTLHYTTLRYTILLYTILNCTMLYNTMLHYTIPDCTILCDYCWRIVVWRALESS